MILWSGVSGTQCKFLMSERGAPVHNTEVSLRAKDNCNSTKHSRIAVKTPPLLNTISGRTNPHKVYVCPVCSKPFAHFSRALQHQTAHSSERDFRCRLCTKSFKHLDKLLIHMRTKHEGTADVPTKTPSKQVRESEEKGNPCPECGKPFASWNVLQQHQKSVHGRQIQHICDSCGDSFTRLSNLKRHIKSVHENESRFRCERCGDLFTRTIIPPAVFLVTSSWHPLGGLLQEKDGYNTSQVIPGELAAAWIEKWVSLSIYLYLQASRNFIPPTNRTYIFPSPMSCYEGESILLTYSETSLVTWHILVALSRSTVLLKAKYMQGSLRRSGEPGGAIEERLQLLVEPVRMSRKQNQPPYKFHSRSWNVQILLERCEGQTARLQRMMDTGETKLVAHSEEPPISGVLLKLAKPDTRRRAGRRCAYPSICELEEPHNYEIKQEKFMRKILERNTAEPAVLSRSALRPAPKAN
ncbi:zinc finger and BTB domain-containing protein 49 [Clonorchis sinensis]|uniref:Zinc finger and BTB domain-containing protein 49 n=1 Tax=Clonorchis sinensis TaxID=79923 RepID=H2KTD5_CLOSI|nr:zinc finger and BTB domain-containing protein 49 [Clonorchis sinensis]